MKTFPQRSIILENASLGAVDPQRKTPAVSGTSSMNK